MITVAVVFDFETKEVISVTIGGEGSPAMDAGQECILVAKEFYDRFSSEDDFLAAVMAEYWEPIDQGQQSNADVGLPSGGETFPVEESDESIQIKKGSPFLGPLSD